MPESPRLITVLTLDHPDRFGAIAHALTKRIRVAKVLQAADVADAIRILGREKLDAAVIYVRDLTTQALANQIAEAGIRLIVTTRESPDQLSQAIPQAVAIFQTPPLDDENLARVILGKLTATDQATDEFVVDVK